MCGRGYSLAKNNAFATKVGRKGCLYFLVPRGLFWWDVFLSKSHKVRRGFLIYKGEAFPHPTQKNNTKSTSLSAPSHKDDYTVGVDVLGDPP